MVDTPSASPHILVVRNCQRTNNQIRENHRLANVVVWAKVGWTQINEDGLMGRTDGRVRNKGRAVLVLLLRLIIV